MQPKYLTLYKGLEKSNKELGAIQKDVGAAAHANLQGVIIMEQLSDKLAQFIRGVEDNPSDYLTESSILSFLCSMNGVMDAILSRRFGNSTRILAALTNKITTARRELFYKPCPALKDAKVLLW